MTAVAWVMSENRAQHQLSKNKIPKYFDLWAEMTMCTNLRAVLLSSVATDEVWLLVWATCLRSADKHSEPVYDLSPCCTTYRLGYLACASVLGHWNVIYEHTLSLSTFQHSPSLPRMPKLVAWPCVYPISLPQAFLASLSVWSSLTVDLQQSVYFVVSQTCGGSNLTGQRFTTVRLLDSILLQRDTESQRDPTIYLTS